VIVAIGDVHAQIPQRTAVESAMRTAQSAAREQDGCLHYGFSEALGEPGHYVIVQRWRDRNALEAHYRSASFVGYQTAIAPLLVADSEVEIYTVDDAFRPQAPPRFDQDE